MTSNEELQKLREISIFHILGIKDIGRNQSICCPLPDHYDSTPSFLLDTENGYHCFGCQAHGVGAIDFLIDAGMEFQEAVEELKKL